VTLRRVVGAEELLENKGSRNFQERCKSKVSREGRELSRNSMEIWTRERKAGSHTQIWDNSEFSRSQFARMQFSACYSSSQGFTNYRGG
jgi:hypothetical protein